MQGEEACLGPKSSEQPQEAPLLAAGEPADLTGRKCGLPVPLPSPPSRALNVLNAGFHGLMENFTLMQSIT